MDIEGWHDFSILYKGDTHVLTVTYGSSQSWSVDPDDVYGKDKLIKTDLPKSLFLCITGSTGWSSNTQKIKIDQFTYRSRPDGKITYIDDDKNGETLNNLFVHNGEKIDENNTSISNGINYWTNQN
uniref:lectin-like domain-containing protein n=1 Tax=Lactobacillus amylovorus TaxID=1604 RepID=UPI0037BEE710